VWTETVADVTLGDLDPKGTSQAVSAD